VLEVFILGNLTVELSEGRQDRDVWLEVIFLLPRI
jgi:hypothetical protein